MRIILLIIVLVPIITHGQTVHPDSSCLCDGIKIKPTKEGYYIVEESPVYPGKNDSFKNFFKTNVKLDSSENGIIVVSFIVSCVGNTCGYLVKTVEGNISKNSEIEIINVLRRMGKWKPGKLRSEVIDVPYKSQFEIQNGIIK